MRWGSDFVHRGEAGMRCSPLKGEFMLIASRIIATVFVFYGDKRATTQKTNGAQ